MTRKTRFRLAVAAAAVAGCAVGGVALGPADAEAFQDRDTAMTTPADGVTRGIATGFWTEGFDPEAMAVQLEEWLAEQVAAGTITQEDVDNRPGAIADAEFPAGGFSDDGPGGNRDDQPSSVARLAQSS